MNLLAQSARASANPVFRRVYDGALFAACVLFASAMGVCIAAESDGTVPDVQTNFADQAVLSKDQIRTVLRLASENGLEKAASISTRSYLPPLEGWDYSIVAKGPETVAGRKISFVEVFIDHRETSDYRVDEVITNDLTTFAVSVTNAATMTTSNLTIRVDVQSDIPLSVADRIVAAVQAGKLRAVESFRKDFEDLAAKISVEKLSEIQRVEDKPGVYAISFGSLTLECTERQDEFVVSSIGAVSH